MPLKRKWTHPNGKDEKFHSSQVGQNPPTLYPLLVTMATTCYFPLQLQRYTMKTITLLAILCVTLTAVIAAPTPGKVDGSNDTPQ